MAVQQARITHHCRRASNKNSSDNNNNGTHTILIHNNKTRNIRESKLSECGQQRNRLGEAANEEGEEESDSTQVIAVKINYGSVDNNAALSLERESLFITRPS